MIRSIILSSPYNSIFAFMNSSFIFALSMHIQVENLSDSYLRLNFIFFFAIHCADIKNINLVKINLITQILNNIYERITVIYNRQ